MILDIDVGNSFVKWRVSDALGATQEGSQPTCTLVKDGLDLGVISSLGHARISSVGAESAVTILRQQISDTFGVELQRAVVSKSAGGVRCGYPDFDKLGIDRWLAMVSAYSQFKRSLIVVDLGSAVTLDVVRKDGQHLGGYILPGLSLMRQSLHRGTAQVRVRDHMHDTIEPGEDTSAAVNRGSLFAVVASIEKLAHVHPSKLIITGGDASLVRGLLNVNAHHEPHLVLDGLSIEDISLLKC
tara:strand:- start:786 stop:1511 length:726 start_codon:yes stop_codon:yes gene_type:complete